MITYIGNRLVNAMPMTREAYDHFRGNPMPLVRDKPNALGFLVEDPKGSANTLSYAGEISWIAQPIFESEFINLGDLASTPSHTQRIHGELAQLQEKLSGLVLFTRSDKFFKLTYKQRELLLEQSRVMTRYIFILEERLSN